MFDDVKEFSSYNFKENDTNSRDSNTDDEYMADIKHNYDKAYDFMEEIRNSDDSMDDISEKMSDEINDNYYDDQKVYQSRFKIVEDGNFKKGLWHKGLYINNFNVYKITTTVMIVETNEHINEKVLFHLLPITKMFFHKKRASIKCELPYCDIPGSIIALKQYKQVRGIVKSEKDGFKHSISIDISTSVKNIHVQLSSLKMKICGSASEDGKLGLEAANLVIDHIMQIQNVINKMKNNKEIAQKTISWILENTKGEKITRENIEVIGRLTINDRFDDYTITYPKYFLPEELDLDIAKFLLSLVNDFNYYSDMCEKISSLLNVPDVIKPETPLKIKDMNFSMVNYSYHLPFEINLETLDEHIHGRNNFYSHYNNDLSNCVTIELAYDATLYPGIKKKKNKIPRITFLCYKTGSVTHSGPGGSLMRESYYLFMITIAEIANLIKKS